MGAITPGVNAYAGNRTETLEGEMAEVVKNLKKQGNILRERCKG